MVVKKVIMGMCVGVVMLSSCLPIIDSRSCVWFKNKTGDTIIVCTSNHARYDKIDSANCCLLSETSNWDYNMNKTRFAGKDKLIIGETDVIPPDSMCIYDSSSDFSGNIFGAEQDHKGWFFVIKLENARKYTWEQICNEHRYNNFVVTQEMLNKGGLIEIR